MLSALPINKSRQNEPMGKRGKPQIIKEELSFLHYGSGVCRIIGRHMISKLAVHLLGN
jgi:hypothetical protein